MRPSTVVLLAALAAASAAAAATPSFSFPEATSVRLKRSQCRCVRLVTGGGMQCSCVQPLAGADLGAQAGGLASQVSAAAGTPQASCQCIQIFISDAPTYQCLCDPRGGIVTQPPLPPTGSTQPPPPPATLQPTQTPPTLPPATAPPTGATLPPITAAPPPPPPTVTPPPPTLPPSTLPGGGAVTYPTGAPPTLPPTVTAPPPAMTTTTPFTYNTSPIYPTPPVTAPPATLPPITAAPPTPPVTYPTPPPVTYAPPPPPTVTVPTVTTASPLPPTPTVPGTTPGFPTPPPTPPGGTVPPSQACQCVMIRINGPANAQYQCSCPGANPITVTPGGTGSSLGGGGFGSPLLPANDSPLAPSYPAAGVTNGTSAGCFCLDGGNPNLGCGCSCDCFTLMVTIPSGVCVCPQDATGRVIAPPPGTPSVPALNPAGPGTVTPPGTLPPITAGPTTYPAPSTPTLPVVYPGGGATLPGLPAQPLQPQPTTLSPLVQPGVPSTGGTTTLPLTTTCIMYPVTGGTGSGAAGAAAGAAGPAAAGAAAASAAAQQCTCMPQYEQCAQNVCCLSSRFRSQKNEFVRAAADATGMQESTLDLFVDMFHKIKNRFSAAA